MKSLSGIRGQSILEYSILLGCVIAAFIAMQIYIKRGIQGRLKATSDDIGEQYAPQNTTTDITTTLDSTQTMESKVVPLTYPSDYGADGSPEAAKRGQPVVDDYGLPVYGIETTTNIDNEVMTRSGSEKLGKFEDKLFN